MTCDASRPITASPWAPNKMLKMDTVFIVTPVYNGAELIDRSIQHVLIQSGAFHIRYHVQDGGSTDGTVQKLEAWQRRLSSKAIPIHCEGVQFSFASEADGSMYEALTKGFEAFDEAPGDAFMTWINYDDLLLPGACALATALGRHFDARDVAWFTGAHNATDQYGCPTPMWAAPLPHDFIASGIADSHLARTVQQEGTFFRKWLWDAVDKAEAFDALRLAGDWNLWRLMAQHARLHQLDSVQTGRFSRLDGQLSQGLTNYLKEIDSVLARTERIARFKALIEGGNLCTPCIRYDRAVKKFEKQDRSESILQTLRFASREVLELRQDYEQARAEAKKEKRPVSRFQKLLQRSLRP